MKACLIMYNADADREIFSILRTNAKVKNYIKWDELKDLYKKVDNLFDKSIIFTRCSNN